MKSEKIISDLFETVVEHAGSAQGTTEASGNRESRAQRRPIRRRRVGNASQEIMRRIGLDPAVLADYRERAR